MSTPARSSIPLPYRIMRRMNKKLVVLYKEKIGAKMGRIVLLLTTTGRKSGLPRHTLVQYEEVDGDYYIGSARGQQGDWFRNILAQPHVEVQVKEERFKALAEPVVDPQRITDYLELRLKRHPVMVRFILLIDGVLLLKAERARLLRYAANLAIVILHPQESLS